MKGLNFAFIVIFALCIQACSSSTESTEVPLPVQADANNPEAAAYNTQLGIGYLREGEYSKAKAKLILAQKQDPTSPEVWDALAFYSEATGDLATAEKDYLKAIQLAPKKGSALNNYGVFLCKQGRYQASLAYFVKANQDPDYLNVAATYENAGLCAEEIPNKAVAQSYFIQALKNNPALPTSSLELGEIYFNQGQYEVANRYLQRYNALSKPSPESLWLDARLAKEANEPERLKADIELLKQNFPTSTAYKQAQLTGWVNE